MAKLPPIERQARFVDCGYTPFRLQPSLAILSEPIMVIPHLPNSSLPDRTDHLADRRAFLSTLTVLGSSAFLIGGLAGAADDKNAPDKPASKNQPAGSKSHEPVPLNKQGTVLLDADGKRLLLKTKVCLREGVLELFCCLKQTKEHESILAIESEAFVIHTGLLALGAKPGSPVQFQPEYSAPKGTRVRIFCQWTDKEGKPHREPAEKWVRNSSRRFFVEVFDAKPEGLELKEGSELKWDEKNKELYWFGHMTEKQRDAFLALSKNEKYRAAIKKFHDRTQPRPLDSPWVFAGSGFYVDEASGKKSYLAEGGDLICVANFPSAMLDIASKSTAEGEANLMWEAWIEHIPPVGTEVLLELIPDLDEKKPEKKGS